MVHDVADDVDHLGEPFHGVVFALDGHEDFGARCQGCLGQLPERWGAIDEDGVEPAHACVEVLLEKGSPCGYPFFELIDILKGPAALEELQVGLVRVLDAFPERVVDEQRVSGRGRKAESAGCVALWVEVDQQRPLPGHGEGPCQVHGSGGLADSTFLICNTKDSCHGPSGVLAGLE